VLFALLILFIASECNLEMAAFYLNTLAMFLKSVPHGEEAKLIFCSANYADILNFHFCFFSRVKKRRAVFKMDSFKSRLRKNLAIALWSIYDYPVTLWRPQFCNPKLRLCFDPRLLFCARDFFIATLQISFQ